MELRKVKLQKEDGITEDEGVKINVSIRKNRAAHDNPYKATSFTAIFGQGIDAVRELAQIAQDAGLATAGSWIYFNSDGAPAKDNVELWKGEKLAFNGKAKFLDFIRSDQEFQEYLKDSLRGQAKAKSMSSEEIEAIEAEEAALEAEMNELGISLDE